MTRWIAFLRAINVGGRNVTMANLRAHFAALEFANVETFIASGNVIFESAARDPAALARKIEAHLAACLGFEVGAFLRTAAEVIAIARYQPFSAADMQSALALNVAFLAESLTPATAQAVDRFTTEVDRFHVHDREVYWLCRVKQSDSKFSNSAFERALKVRATFRGLNTIRRLAEKLESSARQNAPSRG